MTRGPQREQDVEVTGDVGRCCRYALFWAMRHDTQLTDGETEMCEQCSRVFAFHQGGWVNVTVPYELLRKEA